MVIFGGLEIVAAGYLIHQHSKNKKEKQRIEDEAAAVEEERYHKAHGSGRRRRRSHDRHHGYDHKPHGAPRPPQYDNISGPPRANSAPPSPAASHTSEYPPTGWPAHWAQSQTPEPAPRYPPGYVIPNPQHYPQYAPPPSNNPPQGGKFASQPTNSRRGRSEYRDTGSAVAPSASAQAPYTRRRTNSHVRFAVPDSDDESDFGERYSPPPAYRV